jgi:DNA-binding response OmpR family regulator
MNNVISFQATQPRYSPVQSDAAAAGASAHILLVDDEDEVRSILARVLTSAGYSISEAPDGAAALDLLERLGSRSPGSEREKNPVDLIITDIQMREMRGDHFHLLIRDLYPGLPVMMLSAVSDVETAVECMREGAADYVVKPFSVSDIIVRVKRALERH